MILRLSALLVIAAAIAAGSALAGGTWIPAHDVLRALLHRGDAETITIVWQIRLPRIAIGALAGASLAVAGALLQGMLRNPLVDPYLTGVSAGAALAVVAALTLGIAAAFVPIFGFIAGIATALFVAALARRGTGLDVTRLILAGVSLSSLFSAAVALILTRWQTASSAPAIVAWLAGSLSGRGWTDLEFALPYAAAGMLLAVLCSAALNTLRIGELRAASVGANVGATQWMVLAAASLLTATAVTLSGTIGFVGLIVPHIARRSTGSDTRAVIVASAFIGAAIMVLADALCRTLFPPTEVPIGVLLAFAGVPAFLYLYLHRDRRATA